MRSFQSEFKKLLNKYKISRKECNKNIPNNTKNYKGKFKLLKLGSLSYKSNKNSNMKSSIKI